MINKTDILKLAQRFVELLYDAEPTDFKQVDTDTILFEFTDNFLGEKNNKIVEKGFALITKKTNRIAKIKITEFLYINDELKDLIEISTTIERREICDGIIVLPEGGYDEN